MTFANVLLAMGNLDKRTDKLEEAEDLFRRVNYEYGQKNVLKTKGDLQEYNNLFSKATGPTKEEIDRLNMKISENVIREYGVSSIHKHD